MSDRPVGRHMPERVVVVGGGAAGAQSCVALRRLGYAGALTLLCGEDRLPYDRTALSKDVLAGRCEPRDVAVDYRALGIDVHLGSPAVALRGGVVDTASGRSFDFDAVVISTGSQARRVAGSDRVRGVRLMRTAGDALALRAALVPGIRVVVAGAGWLGAEVATVAAGAGCRVTVVEGADTPLGALGADAGALTEPWYAQAGVELHTGVSVESVEPGAVHLHGGERLPADIIVVAVGARPATGWLAGSGVDVGVRGVRVDEHLRSRVPGVFAAGDCCESWSPRFGVRLRVEHWDAAVQAGDAVAASILGLRAPASLHDPLPVTWSEQFGRRLHYVGNHGDADQPVRRGQAGVCWLRGGELVAALTVDDPREAEAAITLVDRRAGVDADWLAEPGHRLADLLTA